MPSDSTPAIDDLGIIGDQRTAAAISRDGDVLWYCPGRFDAPSLFAALLDAEGGAWRIALEGARPAGRRYIEDSGVLETRLATPEGELRVTDWMTVGDEAPKGALCRKLSAAPFDLQLRLTPRPGYAQRPARIERAGNALVLDDGAHVLYASHPLRAAGESIEISVPAGEESWAVLADGVIGLPAAEDVERWLSAAGQHWRRLSGLIEYDGPYRREVAASLRAIRLLTHSPTGGIVAAATSSLPEVVGGEANWDYRYVWLRDAGMIVSALTRLGGTIEEGRRYLDFICSSRGSSSRYPVAVFTALDGRAAPGEIDTGFAGFAGSRPVRIGNAARDQLQLDAFANVLLAAKLIYARTDDRPHWDTVERIAEFLVRHWQDPDHGIWEEGSRHQYTAGKVVAACALDSVADYAVDPAQARRWREACRAIRTFVARHCTTASGAYAVYAGSEEVDVSAALFPVWAYTPADSAEMRATVNALERTASWKGLLYWRRLEHAEATQEGAFLAATFWVAQYWIMRHDLERARRIIDAALACANDLGLFSEEFDPRSERMLGNLPQAFVHAAFLGAVADYRAALEDGRSRPVRQAGERAR